MNTTNALLNRVREVKGLTSDYQLAKLLETTPQNISNWRTERCGMDNTTAMMVAEHLKANPVEILARLQMDKKISKRAEKVWSKYVSRLLLAPVAAATLMGSPNAEAFDKEKIIRTDFKPGIYIIRTIIYLLVQGMFRATREAWIERRHRKPEPELRFRFPGYFRCRPAPLVRRPGQTV